MATLDRVRSVDLVLTSRCNLACGYCYEDDKKPGAMPWATVTAALDVLLGSRQDEVSLLFYGGEPLLEFPLVQRAHDYVERLRRRDQRVRYYIITNGTRLGAAEAVWLAERRFDTQVSFDGVEAAQAERGAGTFERLDALLVRLRRDHPEYFRRDVKLSLTLTARNLHLLADSVAYFLSRGVSTFTIGALFTHEPDWRDDLVDEMRRQFDRVRELSLAHYDATGEIPYERFRAHPAAAGRPDRLAMCGVGRGERLTVDVDGEVTGCVTFAASFQRFRTRFLRERLETLRLGQVGSDNLPRRLALFPEAVQRAEIFDDKQDKRSSYGTCGTCRYLPSCDICPVSLGGAPSGNDSRRMPDFPCAFNLASFGAAERFRRELPGAAAKRVERSLVTSPALQAIRARLATLATDVGGAAV